VEEELARVRAFQCLAILHEDKVTGVREGKRQFGMQIEVRCWNSADAVTATPTRVPFRILEKIADRVTSEVGGVVSVTYNVARKPPSTIEAV
jgi:GMP synthase (glutamine-hydrolysing)